MALTGHSEQVAAFSEAFDGGRPHHAWLLSGPQGLGKATYALDAAIWLLAGRPAGEAFTGGAATPAASLIDAGSHPDFRSLEPTLDTTGKPRAVIRVDEVRALQPLFRQTPSIADWRVVIIDCADQLNIQAANALLKNLEEPPAQTLFFLVSHSPGRLLPTIRSRCRRLRFGRLSDAELTQIIDAQRPGASREDIEIALAGADGLPSRALALIDGKAAALLDELNDLAATPPAAATGRALALSRRMSGKANVAQYHSLLDLAPRAIADAACTRTGPRLAHAIRLWEEAQGLASGAAALSLDPQATAFELGMLVAGLAQA